MFEELKPAGQAWLELDGRRVIGRTEAEILEGIRKLGSFVATAKALGISYSHAWNTVDSIQMVVGKSIVEANVGGRHGGGTRLTVEGSAILRRYYDLAEKLQEFLPGTSPVRGARPVFSSKVELPEFTIIGSDCIGIGILLEMMLKKKTFTHDVISVGSSGGLGAVMLGEADVAGIHLLDEETGEYNTPFLARYWLADRAVLVRGYVREMGLIVAKGNPKGITRVSDLLRKDVKLINRTLGSGTRTLLDSYLKRETERRGLKFKDVVGRIRGYSVEVNSHAEVAKAIEEGGADVGFGIKSAANISDQGFLPMTRENFDFVIEEKRLRKPLVRVFLEELSSEKFAEKARIVGLRCSKDTGNVIYRP